MRTSRSMLAETGDELELETQVVGEGGEEAAPEAEAEGDAEAPAADGE